MRDAVAAAALTPTTLLRAGLLDGLGVVVCGPADPHAAFAHAAAAGCADLGAAVSRLRLDLDEDALAVATAALPGLAQASVLVCDAAGALAAAGTGLSLAEEGAALTAAIASVWSTVRAVALAAFLPEGRAGRVIAIAPPADGRPATGAARAALENLARTLSVEWARHAVTAVSIAPGADGTPAAVAALVAYLASPAGAYYSGCELDLRGVAGGSDRPERVS